jgi:hypothetical protein
LEPQDETMLVFEGKKGSADYHNEMNSLHYQEWFKRVLHHIPNKSAIVIDRAPYHTMQDPETRNPNQSWKKDEIIDWLIRNEIEPPLHEDGIPTFYESFLKGDLIKMAQPKFKDFEYLLDRLIRESGKDVKLIWTPVAHCELNAIELIWAWVKNCVAAENTTFKIKDVEQLVKRILCEVPRELWQNAVKHVQDVEKHYWEKVNILEIQVILSFLISTVSKYKQRYKVWYISDKKVTKVQ